VRNHPHSACKKRGLQREKVKKQSGQYIKPQKSDSTSTSTQKNLNTLHRRRKRVFREKEKTVKKTLIRVLVALALMALGSTTVLADGGNIPCPPKTICSVSR